LVSSSAHAFGLLAVAATLAILGGACFEDAILTDLSTTASGGSGQNGGAGGAPDGGTSGTTTQGGGGAMPECITGADCPGVDTTCQTRTCVDEMCGVMNAAMGLDCADNGGHKCDGAGLCVDCLIDMDCMNEPCIQHVCGGPKDNGEPCNVGAECASTFCPADDHVCCDTACNGACESCLGTNACTGGDGTCAPVTAGTDPDGDCNGSNVCFAGSCQTGKIAFLSSNIYNGNMGGLSGADALCQGLAQNACLPGNYMVWLSTAQDSPNTRFTQSAVPYRRVDGVQIAANYANLVDGNLDVPLNVTETGGMGPVASFVCGPAMMETPNMVWTGTTVTGLVDGVDPAERCNEWSSTGSDGLWGRFDVASQNWTDFCFGMGGTCAGSSAIYCFEQ
jgi:hypothetical protein